MEFNSRNSRKSIISIVTLSESTQDLRVAINSSWSVEEAAERQRLAIQMQIELIALMSTVRQKTPRFNRTLELAS